MHPILAKGRRLAIYLLIFLQAGLLFAELIAHGAEATRLQALVLLAPVVLVHAFSCLTTWYLCRSLPLEQTYPGRLLLALGASALLAVGLMLALGSLWARVLDRLGPWPGSLDLWWSSSRLVLVAALLLFSLAVTLHYLLIAMDASRLAEGRAYELKLARQEAELRALKAQIDPHFLFNCLNGVSALVRTEPERARAMCLRLAEFLRRSLRVGKEEVIPLAQELALAELYLRVEQERFGDRLSVEVDVAEECLQQPVPPLILQPLVENAVRHGIASLLQGGTITLEGRREGGSLRLRLENPRDPDTATRRGEGIGLANVRGRLAGRFGRAGQMRLSESESAYEVELEIPWRDRPEAPFPAREGRA